MIKVDARIWRAASKTFGSHHEQLWIHRLLWVEIHFTFFLYFRSGKTEQEKPLLMLLFENFCNRWNIQNCTNIPSKCERLNQGFRSLLPVVNFYFLFVKEIKIKIRPILSLKSEEISSLQHLSQITVPLKHPGDGNLFSRSETAVSYVINYRNVFRGEQITQQKRRVGYDTKLIQLFSSFPSANGEGNRHWKYVSREN